MAKKMKEQGMIADIPLRSTTKVYYIRVENGMPSGDEGWVTVDEAKRMNATDRRTHGQPMNRYFQDQQSAQTFSSNPPGGGMPSEAPAGEPPMPGADEFGAPDLGAEPGADMMGDEIGMAPDMGMESPMGEEPVDDFGDGLGDEMGMEPDMGGMGDGMGGEDALGDLGGEDLLGDLAPDEEQDFELVVPRRVRLIPAKESKHYWSAIRLLEAEKIKDPGWDFEKLAEIAREKKMKPLEVELLEDLYEERSEDFEAGKKVEQEHTSCSACQRIITCHHIQEFANYYPELKAMEDRLKKKKDKAVESADTFAGLVEDLLERVPMFQGEPRFTHDAPTTRIPRGYKWDAEVSEPETPDSDHYDLDRMVQQQTGFKLDDLYNEMGPAAERVMELVDTAIESGDNAHGILRKLQKFGPYRRFMLGRTRGESKAASCSKCGAAVEDNICTSCKRIQGETPKADYRDEPHNGVKHKRRGESRSTEEGIIEALINGDCTVEEAIKEQTMGTAGQVGFNQRDQSILGRQVGLNTQVKQPQIPWGQPQQQQTQLPPDIQPLYDQYMQALQSGDQMQADKLKQNLVWELQVAGIDPTTVGIR
jgi:hypothetical protein